MSGISPEGSGRACVFCGGTPVTGEHVWPQWIAKYVPAVLAEEKAQHYVVRESEEEGRQVEFRGLRYPFTTEAHCVCERCNTGWMAELEHTAEHELHAMIEGKPQKLHAWRQAIAATWAFKTAMMLEHADSADRRAIPAAIYKPFWGFLRPTTMTNIWMARYIGEEPHHFGHGELRAQVIGPEGPVEVGEAQPYAGIISVGQLAFWYVGHLVQGADLYRPNPNLYDRLIRIWPLTPNVAEWPPAVGVDDEGLRALMFSLSDAFEPPEGA